MHENEKRGKYKQFAQAPSKVIANFFLEAGDILL